MVAFEEITAEVFAQRAFDVGVLDERELRGLWSELGSRNVPVDDFIQLALRRESLTNLQIEMLLEDRRSGFFYGDYEILYKIGEGSFARVFRARHRESGQVVAAKILREEHAANEKVIDQFHEEGRTGVSLRHPNILAIYDVASEGDEHYLVMEFLEGNSLRQFMKIRGRLIPKEAVRLMCDITAGLTFAFERDVTHRDLSMSNVVITSDGHAKLVDFGLAAVERNVIEQGDHVQPKPRTVDYVGLEDAGGGPKDDMRSDTFFAGCMLYHMLTGRAPLEETADRQTRMAPKRFKSIESIYKVAPALPKWLTRIVHVAMQVDPTLRYQTPGEMLADLREAAKRIDNPPPAAAAPPLPLRDDPPDRRSTIIVVDEDAHRQDIYRERIAREGYRVLVIADPHRARRRIRQEPAAIQGVIINTGEFGDAALEVFNELGQAHDTRNLPAILVLDGIHRDLLPKAATADHRLAVVTPIALSDLKELLIRLVPPTKLTIPMPPGMG